MAIGSHRLPQQGAITKRMTAVEDKDGITRTLTLNKLTIGKKLIEFNFWLTPFACVFPEAVDKNIVSLISIQPSSSENEDATDVAIVGMLVHQKKVLRRPLTPSSSVMPHQLSGPLLALRHVAIDLLSYQLVSAFSLPPQICSATSYLLAWIQRRHMSSQVKRIIIVQKILREKEDEISFGNDTDDVENTGLENWKRETKIFQSFIVALARKPQPRTQHRTLNTRSLPLSNSQRLSGDNTSSNAADSDRPPARCSDLASPDLASSDLGSGSPRRMKKTTLLRFSSTPEESASLLPLVCRMATNDEGVIDVDVMKHNEVEVDMSPPSELLFQASVMEVRRWQNSPEQSCAGRVNVRGSDEEECHLSKIKGLLACDYSTFVKAYNYSRTEETKKLKKYKNQKGKT
ncbi:hypothetical protein LXL04_033575 [Taraxacum kok-saghyz]